MSRRAELLAQLHAWGVVVGSAATVAFLANVFIDSAAPAPRYAFERVGDQRCLVDDDAGTMVAGADGRPVCVQAVRAEVRIARQ